MWFVASRAQACEARDPIETRVETENPVHSVLLHRGDVQGIARGQFRVAE